MTLHGVEVAPKIEGPLSTPRVKVRVVERRHVKLDRHTGGLIDEVPVLEASCLTLHLFNPRVHVVLVTLPGQRIAVIMP